MRATSRLWLHFHSVFEFSSKSVLLQTGTSWARFEKRMIHSAQKFCEHIQDIFQKNQNLESDFQIFQIPDPKNRFWGLGTFLALLYVQKIIDLFTILYFFYKFALILFVSFSCEPSRQYGISHCLKTIVNKSRYL